MANKEPEELALDEHNYLTWASNIKLSLLSQGLLPVLSELAVGAPPPPDYIKASTLLIIRNNIHHDLKFEDLIEENPRISWLALKKRYEQRKTTIWPHANYEWANLCLHDFKSVDDYNHALHNICSKLQFCDKEPTEEKKIEKNSINYASF